MTLWHEQKSMTWYDGLVMIVKAKVAVVNNYLYNCPVALEVLTVTTTGIFSVTLVLTSREIHVVV